MTTPKPVILLVHGAWHTPGYYKPLITSLRGAGYTVLAPQLATAGPDDSILGKSVPNDVRRCEEAVAPFLSSEGPAAAREIVVLAHSYGGIPAAEFCHGNTVAERKAKGLQGGVRGIIFLTAFALAEAGMTLAGLAPLKDFFDVNQETGVVKLNPLAIKRFYDVDVPDQAAKETMYAQLGDHSALSFVHPAPRGAGTLPRKVYIVCSRDEALLPDTQRAMAAAIGADKSVEVDGGHSPFVVDRHVEVIVREVVSVAEQA